MAQGFVVLGDAACRFNPIYGQGMTIAGESALVLRRWLTSGDSAYGFQRRLAKMLEASWLLATNEDLRYPTTEGARPNAATRLVQRYLDRLIQRGRTDDVVADTFVQVVHLLQPARTLFQPEIVTRVLAGPRRVPNDGVGPPPARPRDVVSPVDAMPVRVTERFVEGDGGVLTARGRGRRRAVGRPGPWLPGLLVLLASAARCAGRGRVSRHGQISAATTSPTSRADSTRTALGRSPGISPR